MPIERQPSGDPRVGRSFVSPKAAVASPNALATSAGVDVLTRGGTAVDAMVAVNAALGVVYPHMSGPGGDAFWLVHDSASGQQHVYNASGGAARAATIDRYPKAVPSRGPGAALTVPGAVDGWCRTHERFGGLSLADCLARAIEYARDGFPVSPGLARYTADHADLLTAVPTTAETFLGTAFEPPRVGDILSNHRLADTLEAIAEDGRAGFYEGRIAQEIGNYLRTHDGVLSADDLAAHTGEWVEPLRVPYRGRIVVVPPPTSEGMATAQILGILDRLDVAGLKDDTVGYVDTLVRATALAFADRDRYLADPAFHEVPTSEILDPEYLAACAARTQATGIVPPEKLPRAAGDTTFSCAVDAQGNVAAVVQSLYWEWGSGVVAGDTGVLLQNRGAYFSLDPSNRDCLQPGKRPASTLTNGLLVSPTGPELVFGAMGGEGEPQTQAALVTRILDHGMSVQEAIDAPRWLLGRTWGETRRGLRLESRFGRSVADDLTARGHENVSLADDYGDVFGHAQAIRIHPDRLEAASDPRSDGAAFGL
ncbi:gamma-glutamyltransferase [Prescottella equi]|uniref:gamma-glutamyltransferase n=1 Tax=Rhodococcus hoagii TaxID=43767 RepID=UPI0025754BB5|nr:gamma-glutamyltransferase [Prescottella equi]WJJ13775.1 gamma-glutamyltransferase [Prescottella equi]